MVSRICFVNFEAAPFTAGGIGVWLANTLSAYAKMPSEFHVLYYGGNKIDKKKFEAVYPGVKLHIVDLEKHIGKMKHGLAQEQFDSRFQWATLALCDKLLHLEQTGLSFDVIEFVDWGGPASATLQAKMGGVGFSNTRIAVRCHGSEGILRQFEARPRAFENLVLLDLERYALRHADTIVAHLLPTLKSFQAYYGFDDTWAKKAVIELPPVQTSIVAKKSVRPDPDTTPIIFSSKFQSIKRPEIFVRGTVNFMSRYATFHINALFCAFETDRSYSERVLAMIPSELASRFNHSSVQGKERDKIISSGVVVFPNANETFCFAAYEAALMGALIILNEQNPAFGDNTPWIDGKNCLKYDGSSDGLANAIAKAFSFDGKINLSPIQLPYEKHPYWEARAVKKKPKTVRKNTKQGISVIVPHYETPWALRGLLTSVLEHQGVLVEIIIVDDASADDSSDILFEELEKFSSGNPDLLRIKRRISHAGFAAAVNGAVNDAVFPYCCILLPEERPDPGLFLSVLYTFTHNPDIDIVLPVHRSSSAASGTAAMLEFMPLPEPVHTGLFLNRVSIGGLFCRTELLQQQRMNETLTCEWTWDFVMRCLGKGAGAITTFLSALEVHDKDLHKIVWRNEGERRETLDTIRRAYSVKLEGSRMPISFLGDGESISYAWFDTPRETLQVAPLTNDVLFNDAVHELAAIKASTSFRAAKYLTLRFDKYPWLKQRLIRLVRAKLQ